MNELGKRMDDLRGHVNNAGRAMQQLGECAEQHAKDIHDLLEYQRMRDDYKRTNGLPPSKGLPQMIPSKWGKP